MIHTTKNTKWVIAASLVCIFFGLLTFYTFINRSFIELNDFNLQILLFIDLILLLSFLLMIFRETYKILNERKKRKLGSETTLRYIIFFSSTTLLPSILIAVFSLILFTVGLEKYFDKQIKSVVNNSTEIARNYLAQTRDSIEADVLLMLIDINSKFELFYDSPKIFLNQLTSHRLLRRLDEVYLLDSSGDIIMSNVTDASLGYVPPPDEAFIKSLNGKPVRITDPNTNRASALVKLDNFIDTYLYIVKFMDPKVIAYLKQSNKAVSFYYGVQHRKTGIKFTFAIIYVLVVSLLLFLSIIISINFVSRLTRPIISLIGASEKISSGDLNAKVPEIEMDEDFKKLNENFNSMIDKLKKQQDKLLLSERHSAWENVARKLAHEIKNPLTPIQLSIDQIREKYLYNVNSDHKNLSTYLNTMTKQIGDIEHLVNEFSDFARMPKPVLKKVDLNKIVSNALNLYEISEPNIKFGISKIKSSNYTKGDDKQLNRVFINLIKNSVEAIYEKISKNVDFNGKISVDIRNDSDYIYVTVEDNGVGLDLVDKAKIFTPYFTTKKNGTGVGLAVVGKIISDHNGLISLNSINNGAKVEITLQKYHDE